MNKNRLLTQSNDPYLPMPPPTKRELLKINSYAKKLQDHKMRQLKLIDTDRNCTQQPTQLMSTPYIKNQKNIPNVQINGDLLNRIDGAFTSDRKIRDRSNYESLQKLTHLNTKSGKVILRSSEAEKQDKKKNIKKNGQKNGFKLITKVKSSLEEERAYMKKYMKIQKIEFPKPISLIKNKNLMMTNEKMVLNCSQTGPSIEQQCQNSRYSNHQSILSRKTNNKLTKFSPKKSNYRLSNFQINQSKTMKIYKGEKEDESNFEKIQKFNIRKPMMRKQYFVFGMSDRTNTQNKIQYFRDFLWKVNYSNQLYVNTPESVQTTYKAYIGPGNNYHLIKGILKRRFWWTVVEKPESKSSWEELNFVWTQLKQNNYYKFQEDGQLIKYKHSKQMGQKEKIEAQQFEEYQKQLQNCLIQTFLQKRAVSSSVSRMKIRKQKIIQTPSVSDVEAHQRIFSCSDFTLWQNHWEKNFKTQIKINQHTYKKRMQLFYLKKTAYIENSQNIKVHNHLSSNFYIGNKKALLYNLRKYLLLKNQNPFSFIPKTFHIIRGTKDPEYEIFKQFYHSIEEEKGKNGSKNMWIIKPGENTNRGNGISVGHSLDDVKERLNGKQRNKDGKLRTFIVQQYLEKPFLYNKRKFDIRHFMLVSCINGNFKGFWYEEGFIRTSSFEYTIKYCKDPFVHLTNDAIQKNGPNYGKYERGNKLSYQDFQKYIDLTLNSATKDKSSIDFFEHIIPKMKQIGTQTIRATYSLLDSNRKKNNFQLLGLDYMLDQNLKPWLIEVNTNPCLELSCSLLQKIIPQLVDNVFKICIDPLFPPPESWQSSKKFFFGDNPLAENKFQLIFDEKDDGRKILDLYKNEKNILDEKMGQIEEDDEIFEDDGDENWENGKNA